MHLYQMTDGRYVAAHTPEAAEAYVAPLAVLQCLGELVIVTGESIGDRLQAYCTDEGATLEEVRSPSRRKTIRAQRSAIARRLRADGYSLAEIGDAMHKHHSTILEITR